MLRTPCLALAALAVSTVQAPAQPAGANPWPDITGERVRIITARYAPVVGTALRYRADTLVVRRGTDGDTVAIPLGGARALEVSLGPRAFGRGKGAALGFLGGSLAGMGLGGALYKDRGGCCAPDYRGVAAGLALGSATGLVAGAILGGRAYERWKPVWLPGRTRLGVRAGPSAVGIAVTTTLPR
jgi:hypothetical protein